MANSSVKIQFHSSATMRYYNDLTVGRLDDGDTADVTPDQAAAYAKDYPNNFSIVADAPPKANEPVKQTKVVDNKSKKVVTK